jgi:hypothetical protein
MFETKKRDNGETFVTLSDATPQWLKDAVKAAHQDDPANDWIYQQSQAAYTAALSGDLTEDSAHEYADGQVDIYTANLARWYADMCLSTTYANAEWQAEDATHDGDISKRIATIQFYAIEYIAHVILSAVVANHA